MSAAVQTAQCSKAKEYEVIWRIVHACCAKFLQYRQRNTLLVQQKLRVQESPEHRIPVQCKCQGVAHIVSLVDADVATKRKITKKT